MAALLFASAEPIAAQVGTDALPWTSCALLPDKPVHGLNPRTHCESQQRRLDEDYSAALRGDYQAMRNVGFCLLDGCGGAVLPNPIAGCAWRMVIVASGDPRVNDVDVNNVRFACARLDVVGREAAAAQARRLARSMSR
jgi:hypothetical protein